MPWAISLNYASRMQNYAQINTGCQTGDKEAEKLAKHPRDRGACREADLRKQAMSWTVLGKMHMKRSSKRSSKPLEEQLKKKDMKE